MSNTAEDEVEISNTRESTLPNLRATGAVGDVLKLASGTTLAQALTVLASPIVTRLYGPEAFGVAALFASISGVVGAVICLRYELSIMLPETDEEAAHMFAGSVVVALLMSVSMVPAVWLCGPTIAGLLRAPGLGAYLWLLPLIVFLGGLSLGHPALNCWISRTRRYGRLSLGRVVNSLLTTGVQLGAGYAGVTTAGGLIGASFVGSAMSTLVLAVQTWRDDGQLLRRSLRWRDVFAGLRRYRKFPLYGTGSILANSISWQLPALLLSAFFSPAVAGYYTLGNRVLRLPMDLIGSSIGQVFYQRVSVAKLEGRLAPIVESTFRRLVMLGLFPLLLLTTIGRDLFVVAFGERWAEAGVYTEILSFWTFFWLISSPLSTLFSVLERQEVEVSLSVAVLLTRLIALSVGGWFDDARLALLLYAASGVFVYGWLCAAAISASGVLWTTAGCILLTYSLPSIAAGIILLALRLLGVNPLMRLSVAGILLAAYMWYAVRSDSSLTGVFRRGGGARG